MSACDISRLMAQKDNFWPHTKQSFYRSGQIRPAMNLWLFWAVYQKKDRKCEDSVEKKCKVVEHVKQDNSPTVLMPTGISQANKLHDEQVIMSTLKDRKGVLFLASKP